MTKKIEVPVILLEQLRQQLTGVIDEAPDAACSLIGYLEGHERTVASDAAFAEKVAPMHELSWKLRAECSALAGLRDLLLPKLVTGQIDISSLNLDVLMEERVAS